MAPRQGAGDDSTGVNTGGVVLVTPGSSNNGEVSNAVSDDEVDTITVNSVVNATGVVVEEGVGQGVARVNPLCNGSVVGDVNGSTAAGTAGVVTPSEVPMIDNALLLYVLP